MLQVSHPLRVVARWTRCRNYQPRTRNDCNAPHVCCNKGSFCANGSPTMACTAIIKSEQNIFHSYFFNRYSKNFYGRLFVIYEYSRSKGEICFSFPFLLFFFFFHQINADGSDVSGGCVLGGG